MRRRLPGLLALAALPLWAGQADWTPTRDETKGKDLAVIGRTCDVYQHETKAEWGYKAPQKDLFVVVHPKADRKNAPLYVVLHSAGHNVMSCVKCTAEAGNHDIYRSPDDFYALYLDCAANRGDWWWGGMHAKDAALVKKNSGGDPTPAERRVIDTVKWVIQTYAIDPDRVYLCGNSMGGSGTLGIGLRHGDVFAAIKANVPAGIEHVAQRMYFPPQPVPENLRLPDPPVAVDYSAPNDGWSFGHERFVKAMNDRRYALYFYWGPFGHANNSAAILKVNDLINSFDWLSVRRNEAYAVFTNASGNSKLPWPDALKETAPGQVNAFFRWKNISDGKDKLELSLFLTSPADLKTTFDIPTEASADVSLRRIQNLRVKPGESVQWTFGAAKGEIKADAEGVITVAGLKIAARPETLTVRR
jgi:pimeloyl-ACP methyl ester carboxylesterase